MNMKGIGALMILVVVVAAAAVVALIEASSSVLIALKNKQKDKLICGNQTHTDKFINFHNLINYREIIIKFS